MAYTCYKIYPEIVILQHPILCDELIIIIQNEKKLIN